MCENPEICVAKLHEMQFLCIAKRVIVQLAERLLRFQQFFNIFLGLLCGTQVCFVHMLQIVPKSGKETGFRKQQESHFIFPICKHQISVGGADPQMEILGQVLQWTPQKMVTLAGKLAKTVQEEFSVLLG